LLGIILGKDPEETEEILKKAVESAERIETTTEAMFSGDKDPSKMVARFKPVRDGLNEIATVAQSLSDTQPFSFLDNLDDSATKNMRNILRQGSAFLRSIERAPPANLAQAKELFNELAEIPLNVNLLASAGSVEGETSPGNLSLDPELQRDMKLANLGPVQITFRTENQILAKAVLDGLGPELRAKFAGA
jgi:hypothetical protein